ncbi:ribosomal protein L7/L12 [candidate division KSB1 bacterium]
MSEFNTVILVLIFASIFFTAISARGGQNKRLEMKIDLILKHLKIDIKDTVSDQVRLLLAEGKKIQAIKLYRETTGLGLKEAKDIVENMEKEL